MVEHQVYYKHAYDEKVANTHSWRTVQNSVAFLIPTLKTTDTVLDVGCGPGTITLDMAKYIPQGKIIGVEPTDDILARAEQERKKQEVSNVSFQKGSAYQLPFEDNTFDVVFAHQVLLHLENPSIAVNEMRRVTKVGGYVCLKDADLDATVVHPVKYENTIRKYFVSRCQYSSTKNRSGRSLRELVLKNGFASSEVMSSISTWSAANDNERQMFSKMFIDRIRNSNEGMKDAMSKEVYEAITNGWEEFSKDETAWMVFVHGEVTCKKQ